ncbi:Olfactomedin-like protein 2A [Trichinella spiralis]|uniref:Olfactomedin-like protein 2A n=1 Tax=Trichinella spiralis TaxID=6334 RepID=A0ABR3KCL8_TRISP
MLSLKQSHYNGFVCFINFKLELVYLNIHLYNGWKKVVGESYVLRKFELIRKLSAAWQQLSVEEKQNYRNRAAELRNGLETKTPVKTPTESADLPIEPPSKKRRSSTERPSVCPKSMKHWLPSESDKTMYLTRDFIDFNNRIERQSIRFAEQKEQLIKENAELANKLNMVNRRLSLKLPKEKEDQLLIQKQSRFDYC